MEAALSIIYEKRFRPPELWWPDWHAAQWTKVERALDAIERNWLSHLEGPVHMGQIAVACALGYLDLRFPDRDWRPGRPGLATWEAGFRRAPIDDSHRAASLMRIRIAGDDASRQAAFDIRRRVFIEEQEIPEAEEWDDADATCTHFLATDGDRPAGTARLIAAGGIAKIGRVAVLPEFRGTGAGTGIDGACPCSMPRIGALPDR